MTETLRRLRFAWAIICIGLAIAAVQYGFTNSGAAISIWALLALPLYLPLGWHHKLALVVAGLLLTILIADAQGRLITGEALLGASAITLATWVTGWIISGFTLREE